MCLFINTRFDSHSNFIVNFVNLSKFTRENQKNLLQQQTEFCIKNTNEILTSPNRMLASERVGSLWGASGEPSNEWGKICYNKLSFVIFLKNTNGMKYYQVPLCQTTTKLKNKVTL